MGKNFVHLHSHTTYSFMDGICKIEDLVKKAKKLNMTSLAISEHGNVCSWLKFAQACDKEQIKPIYGIEAYCVDDATLINRINNKIQELEAYKDNTLGGLFECAEKNIAIENGEYNPNMEGEELLNSNYNFDAEDKIEKLKKMKSLDQKSNHLILLAKNRKGYENILKISSYGFMEGYYYKPRVDLKFIEKHKEGIICQSACLGGQIPAAILKGDFEKAENYVKEYKRIFGDDFYLELQLHDMDKQREVNKKLLEYSEKYNIKTVISQDIHYVDKEDYELHEIVIKLKNKKYDEEEEENDTNLVSVVDLKKKEDEAENKNEDVESSDSEKDSYFYEARDLYMKSYDEMKETKDKYHPYISDEKFEECMENTLGIANKVEKIKVKSDKPLLPNYDTGDLTSRQFIMKLINDGAKKKLIEKFKQSPELKAIYENRVKKELDTICDLNFEQYFLIVWDIMNFCKTNGIMTGAGRGCLTPNSKIYTTKGIKDISNIKIGDKVITDNGEINKVKNKFEYDINENIIEISHNNDFYSNCSFTKDHKILILKNGNINNDVEYTAAKDIKNSDYLCIPITKVDEKDIEIFDGTNIFCDESFLNIFGLFISYGAMNGKDIFFNLSNKKDKEKLKLFLERYYIRYDRLFIDNKPIKTTIQSEILFNLFKKLLNNGLNKDIRNLPINKIKIFLKQIIKNKILTTNKLKLAEEIKELLFREKIYSTIKKNHDIYELNIEHNDNYFYNNKYIFVPIITTIEKKYSGKVYDLEIENNHSYRTNNYVIHNSGAGSLINHLLDITDLDPLEHDLIFERFINKSRSQARYDISFKEFPISTEKKA